MPLFCAFCIFRMRHKHTIYAMAFLTLIGWLKGATSAVRRDMSTSHCDSCGSLTPSKPRDKLRAAQSRNGDSQGQTCAV